MSGDVDEEVMAATCRALSTHGYADLTMQAIADESNLSKASLHYHYDSKRDLLVAFQEFIGARFLERVRDALAAESDPAAGLTAVVDAALSPPESEGLADLQTALLELKAQAPYEPRHRERSREFDAAFVDLLVDVLEDGVAAGVFRADLDPEETARFIETVLEGAQVRHVSVGQSPETTRALLETHLSRHVYADEEGTV